MHDARQYVGLVSYYRNIWYKREHVVYPLNKIYSTKVKFEWTDIEKNLFMAMENIVGEDFGLYYLILVWNL